MQTQLTFHDKPVAISLSRNATSQSEKLGAVLLIEMQVYFSCLLGKRLAFYSSEAMHNTWVVDKQQFESMLADSQKLADNIYVRFNTVMTRSCPVSDYAGPPPVTDFAIKNQKPYVPDWLTIDFTKGEWTGEYGWQASKKGFSNTKQVRSDAVRR